MGLGNLRRRVRKVSAALLCTEQLLPHSFLLRPGFAVPAVLAILRRNPAKEPREGTLRSNPAE